MGHYDEQWDEWWEKKQEIDRKTSCKSDLKDKDVANASSFINNKVNRPSMASGYRNYLSYGSLVR
jgi:hypothetical protein